ASSADSSTRSFTMTYFASQELGAHPDPPSSPTRRSSDLGRSRSGSASARCARRWPCSSSAARSPHPAGATSPTGGGRSAPRPTRSEEHTSELQSRFDLVCRLLLEKKNNITYHLRTLYPLR